MSNLTEEAMVIGHGLWQRRWVALGVAWTVALVGWGAVAMIPSRFESEATIFVNNRGALSGKILDPLQIQQDLDSTRRSLLSSSVLEDVARKTPLAQGGGSSALARAGMVLGNAVSVTLEQDSIIHIRTVMADRSLSATENAQTAYQTTEGLSNLLIKGKLAEGAKDAAQSLTFLNEQIDARARQLSEAEARRAAFEQRYLSGLPGTGSTEERLALAREELQRIDNDLASAQGSLAAISGQLAATTPSVGGGGGDTGGPVAAGPSGSAVIEEQIANGEARGWTDSHPDMIVLRRQLERQRAIEAAARNGRRRGGGGAMANPAYGPLRAMQAERASTVANLMQRQSVLDGAIRRMTTLQVTNPELSAQKNRLDRDYNVLRTQYDKLLQDREEVKISGQAQAKGGGARYSIIEEAHPPSGPSAPNRLVLNFGVLVAAVGAGVLAAFALGQFRRTYAESSRLARDSAMPVLGAIGFVETSRNRALRRRHLKFFAGGTMGLGVAGLLVIGVNMLLSRVG